MTETLAYYIFGIGLSAALTIALGRTFVAQHGRRLIPVLCVLAVLCGLLLGWAIDGYIAYVRLSAQRF